MSEQGSCWPFVGRGGPLTTVREALRSGAGMMIAGAAGVGKSRLAAQSLAGLPGYSVVRALGTETASMIPFGAFAHVLTGPPRSGENLLRWAARHLRDRAGRDRLLVSVDDAHRLDPASAALVHYLAGNGQARLLVTVRSGEPQPDAVTALWKDELLERIELPPLTVEEARWRRRPSGIWRGSARGTCCTCARSCTRGAPPAAWPSGTACGAGGVRCP